MYSGYLITVDSRDEILQLFPPKFSDVICHHITEEFPSKEVPEQPQTVFIYGYVTDNQGIETLLVAIDGNKKRLDGKYYHITLSLDRSEGYKPVDSNKLIMSHMKTSDQTHNEIDRVKPLEIKVIAKLFK